MRPAAAVPSRLCPAGSDSRAPKCRRGHKHRVALLTRLRRRIDDPFALVGFECRNQRGNELRRQQRHVARHDEGTRHAVIERRDAGGDRRAHTCPPAFVRHEAHRPPAQARHRRCCASWPVTTTISATPPTLSALTTRATSGRPSTSASSLLSSPKRREAPAASTTAAMPPSAGTAGHFDDFGEDRHGDLGRPLGADGEADGRVDAGQLLGREAAPQPAAPGAWRACRASPARRCRGTASAGRPSMPRRRCVTRASARRRRCVRRARACRKKLPATPPSPRQRRNAPRWRRPIADRRL